MPTYETLTPFTADLERLTTAQRRRFLRVVKEAFVPDLRTGCFRPGLQVKGVRVAPGVYELTWAPDGRATWTYGRQRHHGRHIIWHRVGTHDILHRP
ncbi:hypothetical protein OHA37_00025 [Streptomyces sp. NBC_00335]|uniref:hypothetical protein n=1 Tax=unclassified Streptomyces TaxID=2593676 RepID=UPI00224FAD4B|nr:MULTISPECIES: hypothetical protein [unclassified Streptomyces]MCX5410158.1 hypothetical protein [Streptomyces sp. NBC_00086]